MTNSLNDEIEFKEVFRFFWFYKKRILAWGVFMAILGLIIAINTPRQWQGFVQLKIGQIGNTYKTQLSYSPIESAVDVSQKIKSHSLQEKAFNTVASRRNLLAWDKSFALMKKSLKVIQSSKVIQIQARAYDKEKLRSLLKAITEEIIKEHFKLLTAFKTKQLNKIQELKKLQSKELFDVHQSFRKIEKFVFNSKMTKINVKNLSISLVAFEKYKRAWKLWDDIERIKIAHSSFRTYPTSRMNKVFVLDKEVFPSRKLFVVLGMLIGLIIGPLQVLLFKKKNPL